MNRIAKGREGVEELAGREVQAARTLVDVVLLFLVNCNLMDELEGGLCNCD